MRIASLSARPAAAGGRAGNTGSSQAAAFGRELGSTGGTSSVVGTRSTMALTSMDAVLALQALPDATERRRRQMRRGTNLLDQLDELRIALLDGTIDPHLLTSLSRSLATLADTSDDPALDDLIQMIEVRAAVELAKLEVEELAGAVA